jgi:hypothetical protein
MQAAQAGACSHGSGKYIGGLVRTPAGGSGKYGTRDDRDLGGDQFGTRDDRDLGGDQFGSADDRDLGGVRGRET